MLDRNFVLPSLAVNNNEMVIPRHCKVFTSKCWNHLEGKSSLKMQIVFLVPVKC